MSNNWVKSSVCAEIIVRDLCIGCWLCAAIRPNQSLKIDFNQSGKYVATEKGTKEYREDVVRTMLCSVSDMSPQRHKGEYT